MTTDARALIRLTPDESAQLRHHIADHKATCSYSCHLIERLLEGFTAALDRIHFITEDSAVARANVRLQDSIDITSNELEAALDEVDRLRGAISELHVDAQRWLTESDDRPNLRAAENRLRLILEGDPCTEATK